MKFKIEHEMKDADLNKIESSRVVALLLHFGWQRVTDDPKWQGEDIQLYQKTLPGLSLKGERGIVRQITVPVCKFADYGENILRIIQKLAEVEKQCELQLYADLSGEDIVIKHRKF